MSVEEAVGGATAVLSVVPAGESRAVVEYCAPLLDRDSFYVDFTASAVADKLAGATAVEQAGALYVDAAVLGTVATSGFEVPILASGAGASGWKALVDGEGLVVEALAAPAGHATLVKLLRSVYMKGRDALILEMMRTARSYGLEARVAESISGPGEQVSFTALSERVLCALAVHAERRADELLASSEVVRSAGVDPLMTLAGAEVLRRLAGLHLRETFDRERPSNGDQVLAAIEALESREERGEAGSGG
jgi:3-hydroxyisobutyrate dehydrogenase-like beta-hydroxyacid dehydrogenase